MSKSGLGALSSLPMIGLVIRLLINVLMVLIMTMMHFECCLLRRSLMFSMTSLCGARLASCCPHGPFLLLDPAASGKAFHLLLLLIIIILFYSIFLAKPAGYHGKCFHLTIPRSERSFLQLSRDFG